MSITDIFETLMLLSFSVSWYWSIAHMLRTHHASGKSPAFVILICTGYVFGMIAKVSIWQDTGALSPIIYLYAWNLIVTLFDLFLVVHFNRRDARQPVPVMQSA